LSVFYRMFQIRTRCVRNSIGRIITGSDVAENNYSVTVNTVVNSIALEELPTIIEKFPGSITG
jgi:hypothetical protein